MIPLSTVVQILEAAPKIIAVIDSARPILGAIEAAAPHIRDALVDLWKVFVPDGAQPLETFLAALFDRERLTKEQKEWFQYRGMLPPDSAHDFWQDAGH